MPKLLSAPVVKIWLRRHNANASPTQENWVMSKSPTLTWSVKNPLAGLTSNSSFTPICARLFCATWAAWRPGGES